MKNSLWWLFAFVVLPALCPAQTDSAYIAPLEHQLGIRLYTGQKLLMLTYDDDNGTERSYLPNSPTNLGIGISVYNTVISLDLAAGLRFRDKAKYGRTKSFDFQLHHYNRRFAADVYIQRYKGFYEEQDKTLRLHPDMRVDRYSIHGHYVFNHRRFSYKAVFAQTERQIRSAGSWLAGAECYYTKIRSPEPLTNEGYRRAKNYQIGINGGYAYALALGKYWNLGLAGTVGIAFGNKAFEESDADSFQVYPVVCPRLSVVYDHNKWALALSYAGSLLFLPTTDEGNVGIHAGQVKFALICRFGKTKN
ncbi:DUF4421 domain-containing protein [Alistipes sp. OttesenSCG-928-L06]|nr:DUF4421 domain-containing protein [Alistipes sp. OttesenSCG-928-L06]